MFRSEPIHWKSFPKLLCMSLGMRATCVYIYLYNIYIYMYEHVFEVLQKRVLPPHRTSRIFGSQSAHGADATMSYVCFYCSFV